MALIVEDGTGKPDSETYASEAQVADYAAKRGISLAAATEAARSILLVKAMDLLETLEARFQGSRVSSTQALAWPRKGVSVNGFEVAENTLPPLLNKALCQLAVYADTTQLFASGDGREVLKEKVGPLETTYADTGSANPQPALTAFWEILGPLLDSGGALSLDLVHA